LYEILARVPNFLMQLALQVIKFHIIQEKEEIMAYFLRQKQFPGVIGTIYIKNIVYKIPPTSARDMKNQIINVCCSIPQNI